jgi:hypothetical protein
MDAWLEMMFDRCPDFACSDIYSILESILPSLVCGFWVRVYFLLVMKDLPDSSWLTKTRSSAASSAKIWVA